MNEWVLNERGNHPRNRAFYPTRRLTFKIAAEEERDSAAVIHGCERSGEPAETLKVPQALTNQVVQKPIEVGHTIFENGNTLAVQFRLSVEIKHRTSTDHGIQRHQLAFIRAGKMRPALAAVFFPEGGDGWFTHHSTSLRSGLGRWLSVQQP